MGTGKISWDGDVPSASTDFSRINTAVPPPRDPPVYRRRGGGSSPSITPPPPTLGGERQPQSRHHHNHHYSSSSSSQSELLHGLARIYYGPQVYTYVNQQGVSAESGDTWVPIYMWGGSCYTRVSAQVHNELWPLYSYGLHSYGHYIGECASVQRVGGLRHVGRRGP